MIPALLLVSFGFFILSVGWYGWRIGHKPGIVFGIMGAALMTIGALVVMHG